MDERNYREAYLYLSRVVEGLVHYMELMNEDADHAVMLARLRQALADAHQRL